MPRYGAIDIGSNSIRMQAADAAPGQPAQILAEDREVTRLGEGVFRDGEITAETLDHSCRVLARMAATFRSLEVTAARAVATAAVRDARNQETVLQRAEQALGMPVEVISGQEEARLIHLGVQSRWPHVEGRMLIIDIGGGSAEVIFGENGRLSAALSKPLGAVRLTEVFLRDDPPARKQVRQLEEFVREKLDPVVELIEAAPPEYTIGTAATAAAVVSAIHKIPRTKRRLADRLSVSRQQVRELFRTLAGKSLEQRRRMTGFGPRRAEVIVAGCGVLAVMMDELSVPALHYSASGLRDGVIADLAARGVGREVAQLDPARHRLVREMAGRYGVSVRHADKVAALGRHLFEMLQPVHQLPPRMGQVLEAAAYLHDIGHFVSDTRHHKHSYYLVANSDLPGFTDRERLLIANLCRYHRKALPAPGHDNLKPLTDQERKHLQALIPLMRLADGLDRGHHQRVKEIEVAAANGAVELRIRPGESTELEEWAAQRVADLFQQIYGRPLAVSRDAA